MAGTDPLWIDNSSGLPAYSGADLRLGGVVPFFAGAGASLGVRSGVRLSGSGTDLLVQAQASPNMTVKVNIGCFVGQGAISATQGAYTWALDTLTNLTISAAHATLSRTDLIVVRIRDANVDTSGQRDGNVVVITGTAGGGVPSLPTDASYFTIAQITVRSVSAGGGTITSGDIADKRQYTAAAGGFITCTSTTRPTSPLPGQRIWETDTALTFPMAAEKVWNGTFWDPGPMVGYQSSNVSVSSSTATQTPAGMVFPMEATARYAVVWHLLYEAGGNGDFVPLWSLPASATIRSGPINVVLTIGTGGDTGTGVAMHQDTSATPAFQFGGANASPGTYGQIVSYVKTVGTAGNCQFQFHQATSDATPTVLDEGSYWVARRVA